METLDATSSRGGIFIGWNSAYFQYESSFTGSFFLTVVLMNVVSKDKLVVSWGV